MEIVFAGVFLVLLHQGLESLVCSRGDVPLRKLYFDRATAVTFILSLIVGWVAVFCSTTIRTKIGGLLFFTTIPIIAVVLIFTYISQLAYDRARLDEYNADA